MLAIRPRSYYLRNVAAAIQFIYFTQPVVRLSNLWRFKSRKTRYQGPSSPKESLYKFHLNRFSRAAGFQRQTIHGVHTDTESETECVYKIKNTEEVRAGGEKRMQRVVVRERLPGGGGGGGGADSE